MPANTDEAKGEQKAGGALDVNKLLEMLLAEKLAAKPADTKSGAFAVMKELIPFVMVLITAVVFIVRDSSEGKNLAVTVARIEQTLKDKATEESKQRDANTALSNKVSLVADRQQQTRADIQALRSSLAERTAERYTRAHAESDRRTWELRLGALDTRVENLERVNTRVRRKK